MKFNDLRTTTLQKVKDRFWAKVQKDEPHKCWIWTAGRTKFGYGKFVISVAGDYAPFNAHRVAYFLEHPQEHPSKLLVLHSCDNPPCVNPAHLRLGNTAENAQDRSRRGRNSRPMHNAKITQEIADEIRRVYERGG